MYCEHDEHNAILKVTNYFVKFIQRQRNPPISSNYLHFPQIFRKHHFPRIFQNQGIRQKEECQKKVLKKILQKITKGDEKSIPMKKDPAELVEKATKAAEKAKSMKEKAKTKEEKIAATEADEKAKILKKEAADAKFDQAHLWATMPKKDQVIKRIETWSEKIKKMELNIKHKDDNKEVSLGTSKLNYMDPRVSVAFCKRNEVPIEKVFSKTMRDKFNWAMAVAPDWQFNESIALQG